MKKILLLIFIAMPCVAYSGSFVRHGYLFHYDDTVKANGSFQTAVSIYAGDDLTQWNEALITMSGDYYKYITMYFSLIYEWKAREYKVGEYLLVRGIFLTKEEACGIFGIPMHFVLEQYLYTSHKITSKFSLNDADGDCVPDFLDPTPNMPNTIFQLAKDFDCSGKLYKYTIMVDSEDGTQLNIGEPKEYVVNNSPNTNCTDIGAYAPVPVSASELILELLCLQCTGDGFIALDCSGSGNGTDPGDNGTNPGGGSGGGLGGNGTDWGSPPGYQYKISNSTLFDVEEERQRAKKAKEDFLKVWEELKRKVGNSFSINMNSSERLPIFRWNILGKSIVLDMNIYADDLKHIGIMLLFLSYVIAFFIVMDK